MNSTPIFAACRRFIHKQQQQQEKAKTNKSNQFVLQLHTLFTTIHSLIPHGTLMETPRFSWTFCPHLISRQNVPVETQYLMQRQEIPKMVEAQGKKHLQQLQLLILIALCFLKEMESAVPIDTLYEVLGEPFQNCYTYLTSSEYSDDFLLSHLPIEIKQRIRTVYETTEKSSVEQGFFQRLRPVELRWINVQSARFLQLLDSSPAAVMNHLHFIENVSVIELAWIMQLPDRIWAKLLQNLNCSAYQSFFYRYNLVALSFLAMLEEGQVEPFLQKMQSLFLPTSIPYDLEKLTEMCHLYQQQKQQSNTGLYHFFLSVQLLPEEVHLVNLLISTINQHLLPAKDLIVALQSNNEAFRKIEYGCWYEISTHEMFGKELDAIRPRVDFISEDSVFLNHPYYVALRQAECKSNHQEALLFFQEAQKFQEGAMQRDYYSYYYNYWSYYVILCCFLFFLKQSRVFLKVRNTCQ